VPSFAKTGVVVLVCLETLEVKTVGFEAPGWKGEAGTDGVIVEP
jgi:DNA polymerase delta subunit 2